ncbi:LssY C-terminal domain-containing protein [Brachybacterium sp. EF45031]|uniref:LssY C-terminal domain-containing protein n=1 Tax=Brachybacterium sillae TaxID=2810536 RepID=UPI00217CEBB9|nr:LssY C-terminal domain-containing protein [Brachybacterium sillae]MCS6711939.1 LssY C-terminal domain-containing protein [Brachybacterium sillae]
MSAPSARPPVPIDRPVPSSPPVYDHERGGEAHIERPELYTLFDALFVVAGVLMSMWLAGLYLRAGFVPSPVRILYLVGFWLLLTYVTLPRLHQVLTWIYLPDYFIGRTRTSDGVFSDPVNVGLDGSEADVHVAMRRAGWVLAEEKTLRSAWGMVAATLLRRSYPAAPVSDLYLLGRRHDFTYQQEVGGTTSKRHHVRFWRMPADFVLPGGYRTDWLAAGTFDRAVGFSFFTFQVTHRIDENIDVERDYIVDTVRYGSPEVPVHVVRDYSTSYHHRNGQGDRLRTDGDLPVIDVTGVAERSDGATAAMLPRHRGTGSSVLRARAQEATRAALAVARGGAAAAEGRVGRAELAAQWHDALDDFHDALAGAGDHHLPPPTVILTGAVLAIQTLFLAWVWLALGLHVDASGVLEELSIFVDERGTPWIATAIWAAGVLLLFGVLRRQRWARLLLMALFSADAAVRLLLATLRPLEQLDTASLAAVGASVLGVMALSSEAARRWVQTDREDVRRSAVPAAGTEGSRGGSIRVDLLRDQPTAAH